MHASKSKLRSAKLAFIILAGMMIGGNAFGFEWFGWLGGAKDLPLVSRGHSDYSIYFATNAPPSVKIAADELQTHLKLTTGLTLPITNTPGHPMIALGNNPAASAAGIQTEALPYETVRIVTKNGNLYLLGRDLPNDGVTIHGGHSFGTLYAVYEFIERVLGVRWLLPGERGAYIPSLGKEFKLGQLDITYTPPFSFRQFIPEYCTD